ncbi:hypothetical protein BDFB_011142 [Asbolus verrucosus]|uniref:Uncharacterized protein n=1 Tax=Asbolus verrucosus TaxID=1661398 RepID=A0A482W4F3_ASBVE|nr:hypothetical protein BDFB_011142 [Asbolus verrucosus]
MFWNKLLKLGQKGKLAKANYQHKRTGIILLIVMNLLLNFLTDCYICWVLEEDKIQFFMIDNNNSKYHLFLIYFDNSRKIQNCKRYHFDEYHRV